MTKATGGSITYSDGYKIHTFTSGDDFIVSAPGDVDVLVIAGGASGGYSETDNAGSGGGGAGGMQEVLGHAVIAETIAVTVGAGGAARS